MNPNNAKSSEEPPDDWGDVCDAELLNVTLQAESEHQAPPERCSVKQEAQSHPPVQKYEEILKRKVNFCFKTRCRKDLSIPNVRPMDRFFKAHLSVTQLCDQSWCEIKMVYGLVNPLVKRKEMQRTKVTTGASIHLARELEAHPNVVKLPVETREDREAVLFLNMLQKIRAIQAGLRVREFQVFGVLEGVFLTGIVDDLCRSDSGQLVLSDLKTRFHNSFPSSAQAKGHALQVGLYKLLLDSMVRGQLERDWLILHLQERQLRPGQALTDGVRGQAETMGFAVATLGELLDVLLAVLASSNIQGVDQLRIEYCHQSSGGLIGTREVKFEEAQLRDELRGYLAYWRGDREPQGVDIEDAWKCKMCPYEEICDWRRAASENSAKRAKLDSPKLDSSRLSDSVLASETFGSPRMEGPNLDPVLDTPKSDADVLDGPKMSWEEKPTMECSSQGSAVQVF